MYVYVGAWHRDTSRSGTEVRTNGHIDCIVAMPYCGLYVNNGSI